MSSKNGGRHLESGVNAMVVVVMDLMVDSLKEFANPIKTVHVTELLLETSIEGFLEAILPGRSNIADRDLNGTLLEIARTVIGHELIALV